MKERSLIKQYSAYVNEGDKKKKEYTDNIHYLEYKIIGTL